MDFEIIYLNNLYSVDFWEKHNSRFIKDDFVEKTIIAILFNFFENQPNSILHYICDSIDFKQKVRSKLFEKWYNKSSTKNFSKLDLLYLVEKENIEYKLEFVFNNAFYDIKKVQENVVNQIEEFSSFK